MITAKKLVAVVLRLFALGVGLYPVLLLLMLGGFSLGMLGLIAIVGIPAALLFIYAIPLARLIADDIDRS